jgi:hypothetical protein
VSSNASTAALEALVEARTQELHLPTVRRRFRHLADEAARAQQTPLAYLAALLEAEVQERAERRERRRLIDARFPLLKRLEDFRFDDNPNIPQATIAALAEGSWIDDREGLILLGESGTGKTHCETGAGPSWAAVRVGAGSGGDDSKDSLIPSSDEGFPCVGSVSLLLSVPARPREAGLIRSLSALWA